MKQITILTGLIILLLLSFQSKVKVDILPYQTVELSYAEFQKYDISLFNNSTKTISVSVVNPDSEDSGFGLEPFGKVSIHLGYGAVIKLQNKFAKTLSVNYKFIEKKKSILSDVKRIDFKLINSTSKSIALIIPGVMNPNLSPNSTSGVNLKTGQKIYYKKRGRSKLLLVVDSRIKAGDELDVSVLIRQLEKDQ